MYFRDMIFTGMPSSVFYDSFSRANRLMCFFFLNKETFRSEGIQEFASPLRVCLSEKWAKVHKLAEAGAETQQTASYTGRLQHLNLGVKNILSDQL